MDSELSDTSRALSKVFSSSDLVLKTQCQIAKDFANHGFQFDPSFETEAYAIERLEETVQQMLSEIIEKQPAKWLPLMYSLDISEKNYVRFFENAQPGWLEDFAQVVIRREAQKVFFREKMR